MTLSREALGARLRPLLSATAGRGCVELLTLAGLPSGRGYAQTAAVALNELVAKGLARREKPYGHGPKWFAVLALLLFAVASSLAVAGRERRW